MIHKVHHRQETLYVPSEVNTRQVDGLACTHVLLCFIDPRVRKIRNEASSCPEIFSRTLRFYYVASSPGSPLPHLLDGHRKFVGSSSIPARSCPGPVRYHWGSIVELEVPPDETPGLMTLQPHNTNDHKASHILNHHTHPTDPIARTA